MHGLFECRPRAHPAMLTVEICESNSVLVIVRQAALLEMIFEESLESKDQLSMLPLRTAFLRSTKGLSITSEAKRPFKEVRDAQGSVQGLLRPNVATTH